MDKILTFFHEIQPLVNFFGVFFSLAVLGFIIKLFTLFKSVRSEQIKAIEEQKKIIEEQKKIIEERLKNSEADLARTEKWHEQEKTILQEKLSDLMKSQNINLDTMSDSNILSGLQNTFKEKIDLLLEEMKKLEGKINTSEKIVDPKWYIEMAKGFTVTGNWRQAAEHYEEYLKLKSNDWHVHFLQGVAYQNIRGGNKIDFKAMKAYSNAIVWMPNDLDNNKKSRLYTYKGASLKRLKRLDESEVYLLLGERFAVEEYEIYDNKYNQACIYAMTNNRERLFEKLSELSIYPQYLQAIKHHSKSYFNNFSNDPDFLEYMKY